MDRRKFLKSTAYFTVVSAGATLAACGGTSTDITKDVFSFTHGVASGDPKATSIVFWTRCIRKVANGTIPVRLDISTSESFATVDATVELAATAAYDFTVRAKVTELKADTRYFYRFVAGRDISPVGQAKTAAIPSAVLSQVRFAWMTCQDWSVNHWAAMELLAAEELDFVVHLGDYIYETVGASFQSGKAEPAHTKITLPTGVAVPGGGIYADSLEDYRTLYRTYRSDARLQELHRKFPMIAVWDDHEFSDDCWQDRQTYTNENKQQTARRRNATQAWAEYMPIDFGDVSFDLNNTAYNNIRIYRDFRFGNLVHLVMTDERLYRDDHLVSEAGYAQMLGHDQVNGEDKVGTRYFVPQPLLQQSEQANTATLHRTPCILGPTQTQWWKNVIGGSLSTWKVWGNEVTLNRMWLDMRSQAPAPYDNLYVVNADAWDGYPAHRAELMSFLKTEKIKNVVAITGDLHAFQCGTIRDNPDPALGTPVAVDFVAAGISSSSFYDYLKANAADTPLAPLVATPQTFDEIMRANNPDFAYVDHHAQGYAVATVTANAFTVLFNKVQSLNSDGTKPASPLAKRTRITVQNGSTAPVVEDNVA